MSNVQSVSMKGLGPVRLQELAEAAGLVDVYDAADFAAITADLHAYAEKKGLLKEQGDSSADPFTVMDEMAASLRGAVICILRHGLRKLGLSEEEQAFGLDRVTTRAYPGPDSKARVEIHTPPDVINLLREDAARREERQRSIKGDMADAFSDCLRAYNEANEDYVYLVKGVPVLEELWTQWVCSEDDPVKLKALEEELTKYPAIWAARERMHALLGVTQRIAKWVYAEKSTGHA